MSLFSSSPHVDTEGLLLGPPETLFPAGKAQVLHPLLEEQLFQPLASLRSFAEFTPVITNPALEAPGWDAVFPEPLVVQLSPTFSSGISTSISILCVLSLKDSLASFLY